MQNVEIKPGYKQTETGVIPEDWDIKPLGDLASVTSGGTPSRTNLRYWNGTIPWVTTSEVDFCTINYAEQFITKEGLDNSAAKLLPYGTLLMALYGQGKTRGKVGLLGIKAATNQACAAILLKNSVSGDFIFHYLISQYDAIRNLSNTGNQENLNSSLVRSIPILLPPETEQRLIATALSDMDELLGGLDRLIAKKRDLKQASMQQLLTGKTRLPGFGKGKGYKETEIGIIPEDWDVKVLGFFIQTLDSGVSVNSIDSNNVDSEEERILKTSCVFNGRFLPEESKKIIPQDLIRAKFNPRKNSIIISRMNTPALVGECGYVNDNYPQLFLPDRLWMTRPEEASDCCSKWLADILSFKPFSLAIKDTATGTSNSMKNISKPSFLSIKIPFLTKEEQTAIATILSDMDAAIAALEQRRNKTHNIKQAMMQELLTGKTRLV